jgi:flagellin-like protein
MQYSLRVYHPTGCEKMKRLFRNKKAVSPVVATVLMILVTMAGMSILFGFVISYSDSYKAGIGGSVLESLTVEDIWFKDSNNVQISLYNSGTMLNLGRDVDLTVATVYVSDVSNLGVSSALINPDSNVINFKRLITAGEHYPGIHSDGQPNLPINCRFDQGFVHGNTYSFKIVTMRGSNFEAQATYT